MRASKKMGIVLISNRLLDTFLIVFFYQANSFFTSNSINQKILFCLEEFERYEDDNNFNELKHKC